MGYKRNRNEYATTVDKRAFHILHIKSETGCCLKCKRRKTRKDYGFYVKSKHPRVHPNWKLTTKRRKQWMGKEIIIQEKIHYGRLYMSVTV